MDITQQQLWTYLNWLQETGQVFAKPLEIASDALVISTGETFEFPAPPKAPAKVWDLTFISSKGLLADETLMVQKIASALGYSDGSFAIVMEWMEGAQAFAVFLGEGSPGVGRLVIPHPGAMLRDPSLKRQAWEALQAIKRN